MFRKTVSLTLGWMFAVSALSGLVLYISPPGRVAHWSGWSLLGLDKTQWDNMHTVTTILMIVAAGLHVYYNWKPLLSYMKDKASKALAMTRELALSLLLTFVIALGATAHLPPFAWISDLGDYVSEEWETTYGSPPYGHAELDTLATFAKRIGLDPEGARERMRSHGIAFAENQTLLQIADAHGLSPQHLYELIAGKNPAPVKSVEQGSGMGKKTFAQVCELHGLEPGEVARRLEAQGLVIETGESFKSVAERNGMHPLDLLEMVKKSR